jgi:hypothetical protein
MVYQCPTVVRPSVLSQEDIVVKLKDIDQSYKSQRDKSVTVEFNLQGLTDSNRTTLNTLDERMTSGGSSSSFTLCSFYY